MDKKKYFDPERKKRNRKAYQNRKDFINYFWLRQLKLLDAFLMTLPFGIAWYKYFSLVMEVTYYRRGNWMIIALYFLLYVIYGRMYEAFLVSYIPYWELIYSQMLSAIITNFFTGIVLWLLGKELSYLWPLLIILVIQFFISLIWTGAVRKWYAHRFAAKKTIIVYDIYRDLGSMIKSNGLDTEFDIIGTYKASEILNDMSLLDNAEVIFLSGVHSHDRNIIIKYCVSVNLTAFIIPRVGDTLMSAAKPVRLLHLPLLRLDRYNPSPEFIFFKRLFDVVFSAFLIVLLSPLMGVLALLIRRDGGPALYRQVRLTKDGKQFEILKFRSMRVDAEKDGVARLSTGENDDRITKIGKFIRKVRFDELPQLFNILKGDMSFVGPRPERPEIASEYEKTLPEFRLRLQAKAGLTGLAQVHGKYNTEPYDKLQMDLMYIANPSIAQDIRIIFATIKIIFMKESTEGIAEGQVNAECQPIRNPEDDDQ